MADMSKQNRSGVDAKVDPSLLATRVDVLEDLTARRDHLWQALSRKWSVSNPVPPWKSSLDGMCDALDDVSCAHPGTVLSFRERRNEEDALSQERYADLPFPESQLVALAHSLIWRGVIDEGALRDRMVTVRQRLET
ncbi:thiocyanate hydrolase [Nocardia jiangxiensis]|uniref:Thiocyanate hydrolase n=1 Tax=Nocardia jiangxiensis TaxID=282685 RepID=A0ABW6SIU1_9NOCA|nr:thiocyanate hydrolase [Nocardia jiangxiensis]